MLWIMLPLATVALTPVHIILPVVVVNVIVFVVDVDVPISPATAVAPTTAPGRA
jgi:hypothetical protein